MIAESLRDKLRKVLAIAQSGQAGEREAARNLLEKLLFDNGYTMANIIIEIGGRKNRRH